MFQIKIGFFKFFILFLFIFQIGMASAIPSVYAATNIGTDVTADGDVKAGDGSLVLLGSQPDPDPAGVNGALYYNTTNNKFRCYENSSWKDCITLLSPASLSSIVAAIAGNIINNGDNAQRWNWQLTTADKVAFTFGENVASTAGGEPVILKVVNMAASTALPFLVENKGDGHSFRVNDSASDVTPFLIDKDGHVAIGSNSFDPVNPEMLKVDSGAANSYNIIKATGNLNNYLQMNIQNRNSGGDASSDIVATANNGNEDVNYIDMGINSSGYSNVDYSIGGPNDGYLYVQGVDNLTPGGNLSIGTGATGKVIKFHTGGTELTDERMRIDGAGNVGIGTDSPGSELDVNGEIRFSNAALDYVGFTAPAVVTTSTTYTLPAADGTGGQALVTDGSGKLLWASATSVWQRVGTVLSPLVAGDDITTSGNIYTEAASGGTITSDGLLTGNAGAEISGATTNINASSNFATNINTGTSTGTVMIGNSLAGAIDITSGAGLTLNGGATSGFSTTAGNIALRPAGTGTTAYVQIGDGGVGSTTPDLLALDVKSDAGDPAGTDGATYYNANTNKFRCHTNGSCGDCDTTGGTTTLQSAYNAGAIITTAGATDIAFTLTSGDFTASGAGSVNLTPTGASSFTSGGALTLTGGAASTWGTSSGDLTLQAAGTGTTAYVKIGDGGIGSATPDLFGVDVKSTTGDPAIGFDGAMYYNKADSLFRCYEAGGWKNCGSSAASATTLQQAYIAGPTITTTGSTDVALVLASGDFTATGAGSVNLTPTGASSFISGGALTLDSAGTLNLGTISATAVNIGSAGITTINEGTLQTGDADTAGSIKIADGLGNYITLNSPSIIADYTLTLPVDDGTNGQFLVTDGGGALYWTDPEVSVMDTIGDMLYRNGSNVVDNLAIGASGTVLKSDGTVPAWATLTSSDVGLGNVTNDAQLKASLLMAKGDLVTYNGTTLQPTRLPIGGTNGFVLTVDDATSTGMKWAAYAPGDDTLDFSHFSDTMIVDDNTSINLAGNNLTIADLIGGAALTLTAGAASTWSTSAGALTIDSAAGLNLGTTTATGITIGQSGLITTNIGSLQTGNAAITGSLRIADGSANYITLTSPAISADYTLTMPVDGGTSGQALTTNGSGTLSWSTIFADPMTTIGDLVYRDGTNTTTNLAIGASGTVLKSNGAVPVWTTLTSSDVGLGNVTNEAQIPKSIGAARGDIIVYTASNTPVNLPVGTNNQYLTANSAQATGLEWVSTAIAADSLNFTEFSDSMTVDANTSIDQAGNSLIISGGALNLNTTGTSNTSIGNATGSLTFTSTNFNTTATGINSTAIGATTRSTGAFTTLAANGNVTLGDATADTTTINSKISIPSGSIADGGTSNTVVGRVTSGGGNTTVVVTNSLVTANSHVFIMPESARNLGAKDDEWFYVTHAAGSFTITGEKDFADGIVFSWLVIN